MQVQQQHSTLWVDEFPTSILFGHFWIDDTDKTRIQPDMQDSAGYGLQVLSAKVEGSRQEVFRAADPEGFSHNLYGSPMHLLRSGTCCTQT